MTELPSVLVSSGLLCEKGELFTHLAGGLIRPTKGPVSGQWATKVWGAEHQGTRNVDVSGKTPVRSRGHTCILLHIVQVYLVVYIILGLQEHSMHPKMPPNFKTLGGTLEDERVSIKQVFNLWPE